MGLLFTYALTYGGALVSLSNPFIGLLIYFCFAILKPDALWFWSVPQGNYSRIVAVALLVGWAFKGFGNWQFGRAKAIVVALVGFWVWSVISACDAPHQDVAWGFVESMSKILLPFIVGITLIDSMAKVKQVAWVLVISHAYLAFEFNVQYYQGFNRVMEMGHGGVDEGCMSIAMCAATGMTFFLGMAARRWQVKIFALFSGAFMINFIMFSFIRSGMLGLVITLLVSVFLVPKQLKHYAGLAFAVTIGMGLAGTEVREEFMTIFSGAAERDASAQSRVELWSACVDVIAENPVLGIGPDHFTKDVQVGDYEAGKEAHNLWLQIGAELGIPGLLLLVTFYGLCVVRLWPIARQQVPVLHPWSVVAAQMVIAAITGFVVASQFISLEGLESPYYIILVGAAVLKLSSPSARATASQSLQEPEVLVHS